MSSVDPNKRNGWSSCRKVEDGWRVGWQQKRRDADFLVRVFGAFFPNGFGWKAELIR